ncbi:sulfatase family protein [Pelagicoccus mobilis]|uniref:Sulfatase n=1 Tax=Pelagicoccus mobilis TaxID=415221 RepID=A0A934RVR9_9BACT|nr:sulfatase [Pelagicoccus mobilis]MBK1877712.1 sulfatase [Pelagicoccus mobilis]
MRQSLGLFAFGVFHALLMATPAEAGQKPNMVIFLADDHGRLESSVYGHSQVKTPQMQKLADEGMVFEHAYVASPACGPSRAALMSGLMPARNGAEANHTNPRPETQSMVRQLQEQGYEVVSFGKIAHGKKQPFMLGFDHVELIHKDSNIAAVRKFLVDRKSKKPLCLMVGDHRPHVSWTKEMQYDPAEVELPPHLIDTKEAREHWARYLTDITHMDSMMAAIDKMAEDYFGTDDYLFLYSSDHGGQWPMGKWNLYDSGTRVPFIVRWPGKIKPGARTKAMVSWVDLMPTLIDIAGGKTSDEIDGRSFTQVLLGEKSTHRSLMFTTHSGDSEMNVYPIRAISDGKYKYIRNLEPDCYHSNHSDILRVDGAGAFWHSWDEAAKTNASAAAKMRKYYQRPAVEFFDLSKDPYEYDNLANSPEYKQMVQEFSNKLDTWMKEQGDTQKTFRTPYPLTGPTPYIIHIDSPRHKKKPLKD